MAGMRPQLSQLYRRSMPGARRGFQSVACAKTLFLRQRYVSNTEINGLASLSVAERILAVLDV
eukprot:6501680-Lingulodinium_polyedra.AAC.1